MLVRLFFILLILHCGRLQILRFSKSVLKDNDAFFENTKIPLRYFANNLQVHLESEIFWSGI